MGTDVKLLYKQLVSCLALRAITARIPHHPLVVAVKSGNRVDFSYACGRYKHSFPFRAGCQFVPHPQPDTAFHLHFLHPPQHRAALVFLFSLHIFRSSSHTHAIFPPISSGCLPSSGEFTPKLNSNLHIVEIVFIVLKVQQKNSKPK